MRDSYKDVIKDIDLRHIIAPGRGISGNRPIAINCTFHSDEHASLMVYPDHLHCFGCGIHMSILDWVAQEEGINIRTQFSDVVRAARRRFTNAVSSRPLLSVNKPKKSVTLLEPMNPKIAEHYHNEIGDKRQWFEDRGLTTVIDEQLLGYSTYYHAFTIPIWNIGGQLLTIRYRRDDSFNVSGNKYWGIEGRNRTFLYNGIALTNDFIHLNNRTVVLCEGELDCLRLWQEDICSVSFTNGVNAFTHLIYNKDDMFAFSHAWKIVIAFDQDDAGRKAAEEVVVLFPQRGFVVKWEPELGKDITEIVKNKGIDYVKAMLGI